MVSPRIAFWVARLHKWLGLIVGMQFLVWTASGLFFAAFNIAEVRGDDLFVQPGQSSIDLNRIKLSTTDALDAVAEDHPYRVTLRNLGSEPVYEIHASIGMFLVSAETGAIRSPINEQTAIEIAKASWKGEGRLQTISYIEEAPREAGGGGPVWAADFGSEGKSRLYVNAINGAVGPARTDLWRAYDFLWSLHIMDYTERENYNNPLILSAGFLALSLTLFGIVLVLHRFTRSIVRPKKPTTD